MRERMVVAAMIVTVLAGPLARADDRPAGRPKTILIVERWERHWHWWVPWAVTGGGLVLGAVAGMMYAHARSEMSLFDRDFQNQCASGCAAGQLPPSLADQRHSAVRDHDIALGMLVGAGVLVVAGGVLNYMNRPYKVIERRILTPDVDVSPGRVTAGLAFSFD